MTPTLSVVDGRPAREALKMAVTAGFDEPTGWRCEVVVPFMGLGVRRFGGAERTVDDSITVLIMTASVLILTRILVASRRLLPQQPRCSADGWVSIPQVHPATAQQYAEMNTSATVRLKKVT